MGAFDNVKATQVPSSSEPIVKARKVLKKGYLFGHISNGNGIIRLDGGFAIKVIALNETDVILYLLDYGNNITVQPQTCQKTKGVVKKQPIGNKIESDDSVDEENLF